MQKQINRYYNFMSMKKILSSAIFAFALLLFVGCDNFSKEDRFKVTGDVRPAWFDYYPEGGEPEFSVKRMTKKAKNSRFGLLF